jgi:hypothetical protein
MRTKTTTLALAAALLLAGLAGAEVSAVSGDAALNTRSFSAIAAEEDQGLDTRGFTVDWSAARKLNTKKIRGTMMLLR